MVKSPDNTDGGTPFSTFIEASGSNSPSPSVSATSRKPAKGDGRTANAFQFDTRNSAFAILPRAPGDGRCLSLALVLARCGTQSWNTGGHGMARQDGRVRRKRIVDCENGDPFMSRFTATERRLLRSAGPADDWNAVVDHTLMLRLARQGLRQREAANRTTEENIEEFRGKKTSAINTVKNRERIVTGRMCPGGDGENIREKDAADAGASRRCRGTISGRRPGLLKASQRPR